MNSKSTKAATEILNNLSDKNIQQTANYFTLREAGLQDNDQIRALYKSTVKALSMDQFTAEQKTVWANIAEDIHYWNNIITHQQIMIAEYKDELDAQKEMVGFGSITKEGYIEMIYVSTSFQNIGVGRRILKELESICSHRKIEEVWVDVSANSRSFFKRHGYIVEQTYTREVQSCLFKNVLMRKMVRTNIN